MGIFKWIAVGLSIVSGIRVNLLPLEEECIGVRANPGHDVLIAFEAFPSDESRIHVKVSREKLEADTMRSLHPVEKLRTVPAWNSGNLNLTADVFEDQETRLIVCFGNTGRIHVAELTFAIRADDYERLHDVATKDHTVGLLKSVMNLSRESSKLSEQQHFLVARENAQRKAIKGVHRNTLSWSLAQAVFMAVLAGGQIVYIRKQFQSPKTIL
eukprot:Gregarina_sp_Poly_1__6622@NODE_355_length_9287_cov_174_942082_g296_i0_p4_GENE_NODE_355_length_9287_cov_174_942082_g296_i0NODE_355_length_9287_cov_174_942082_g296_i0_p4_ORF_typecomplete_len213_score24_99EMP24_GP25L/PF01105_24/9_4e16_NODE_355_length_9287_cov_174_942082_g296_i0109747